MKKKKASATGDFSCANVGCPATGRDKVNKRCARCGAVWYCSRRCQRQHWDARGGNHRGHCKPAPSPRQLASARASPTVAAAGRDDGNNEPAHPCPICLVNEDNHGQCGQCFECGRLYCGDCNVPDRMGRVANCPTCRAPVTVSAKVRVKRLRCLIARSPGRHTPVALSNLGAMYQDGTGVPQDATEAARLYRIAADQGGATGQLNLGMMHAAGAGIAQDFSKAARWYRLAADQGEATGQFNLGVLYADGTGVPQDFTEAARWHRLAADQGHTRGQFNLGTLYADGTGVAQDYTEAARLYRLAADQGHTRGQFNLGAMYQNGMGVPQDHTEAVRWYRLAADQGLANGQHNLGVAYEAGTGVPQDCTEAVRWYRLAADQGLATGQFNLGMMYSTGTGVPHDFTKAARFLKLACDQGVQPARDLLDKLTAQWPTGTRVKITGLAAAAHLNGMLGTAVTPTKPLAAGRIAVRIDGQTKSVSLSWANLGQRERETLAPMAPDAEPRTASHLVRVLRFSPSLSFTRP